MYELLQFDKMYPGRKVAKAFYLGHFGGVPALYC